MTEARWSRDMARMELAGRIGVSFREVGARERGNATPGIAKAEIADILGVNADYPFGVSIAD